MPLHSQAIERWKVEERKDSDYNLSSIGLINADVADPKAVKQEAGCHGPWMPDDRAPF